MIVWITEGDICKTWVARVTGLDETYGLAREFLKFIDRKNGQRGYLVQDGILYQMQDGDTGGRWFMMIRDGKEVILDTDEAMALIQEMEAKKEAERGEVDDVIKRVNFSSEGGFSVN